MNTGFHAWRHWLALTIFAVANAHGADQATTDATAPSDTAIVLDASGSMWGQIDGVAKIEIARNVLNDILADWPPNHRLGLTAYGHRREGDCEDIESLIELGAVDIASFKKQMKAIQPKGKTPLSAAVQQAAAGLAFTERPATVILVSDGLENCNLDPCQVADQLEAEGVDFTAHVIGFDVGKEDTAGLRCLAERTGGTYASAETASDLSGALQQVVEKTRTDPIQLVAVLNQGGEPLTKGVSWEVQEPEPDFDGKYKVVTRSGAPQAKVTLDNGKYRILARRGATRVPTLVEIDDATRRVEVVLGAGDILMRATLGENTPPIERGVSWTVFEPEPDFEGKYKKVTISGAPQAKFTLPAGEYRILARRDATEVVTNITVVGGEQNVHTINLKAGDIKATATLGPNGPTLKRQMSWRVESPEPNFEGKYERFKITGADEPTITLPAGNYRLVVKRGDTEQAQPIEVSAGEQKRITVAVDAGEVIATAHLAPDLPPLKRVSWQIQKSPADASGKYPKVSVTGADEPRLTLPTGSYRLVPSRDRASAEKFIEVTAGSQQRHQVVLDAGEVFPTAVDGSGNTVKRGLSWAIFTINPDGEPGERVGVTGAAEPKLTLNAGNYRLQARTRGGNSEVDVSVAAGQQLAPKVTVGQ